MNKIIILIIAVVVLMGGAYFILKNEPKNIIEDQANAPADQTATCDPKFEDFKVQEVLTGKVASVDFSSNQAAYEFRGAIKREISEKGVNLAGHYTLASWGCGTSCQQSAIIDDSTGSIIKFDLGSSYGIETRATSSLIVVNPKSQLQGLSDLYAGLKTSYYDLGNNELKLICETKANDQTTSSDKTTSDTGKMCAQVITPAKNLATGEVKDFPTPCDIPQGWEKIGQ